MPFTTTQPNPTPQSWSSYIFSTYSTPVTLTHDPDQYAPTATPVSPTPQSSLSSCSSSKPPTSMSPTTLTSSTWGPYTKSGRGGAGNFTWKSQSPSSIDPESAYPSTLSARQKAAAEIESQARADAEAAKQISKCTHLGRGGAGNFTPPVEVAAAGEAPEAAISPAATTTTRDGCRVAKRGYVGRGGAGNYNVSVEDRERQREREREVRRRVEESLEMEMRRSEGVIVRKGRGSRVFA